MKKNILIERKKKHVSRETFAKYNSFNNVMGNSWKSYNVIDSLIIEDKNTKKTFNKFYATCISKALKDNLTSIRESEEKNKNKVESNIKTLFDNAILQDFFKSVEVNNDEEVIHFLNNVPREKCYRVEPYYLLDKHLSKQWDLYKNMNYFDKDIIKKQKIAIKKYNNAPVREKVLRDIVTKLVPIFSERGYHLDLSKVDVSFNIEMSGKVLGRCYHESWDKGNHGIAKNKLRQIAIRGKVFKTVDNKGKETIVYNPNNIRNVLEVLIHELVHAYHGTEEGHGSKFKSTCKDVGLTGGGKDNTKFTCTQPAPEFDSMYKDILKIKLPSTEFHYDSKGQSKNQKYRCPICKMRCTVTNRSAKHSETKMYCNHEGTEYEGHDITQMEQYETKKK